MELRNGMETHNCNNSIFVILNNSSFMNMVSKGKHPNPINMIFAMQFIVVHIAIEIKIAHLHLSQQREKWMQCLIIYNVTVGVMIIKFY